MFIDDTIAAIATAPGEGGIGIIRISGRKALPVAQEIFESVSGKKIYRLQYSYVNIWSYSRWRQKE